MTTSAKIYDDCPFDFAINNFKEIVCMDARRLKDKVAVRFLYIKLEV